MADGNQPNGSSQPWPHPAPSIRAEHVAVTSLPPAEPPSPPAGESDLAAAERAVAEAPDAAEPVFHLCCLLLARQDSAANALLPLLQRFIHYAPGWLALGQTLLPRQPAGALVAFTRAQAASRSVPAALGQAAALSLLGRHAEAEAACQEADALAPEDPRPPTQLGRVRRQAGDWPGAREAFAAAAARDPGSAQAWFSLGVACQDLHDHPAAVPAFRTALAAKPDWHEAAFNLAVACQETGDLPAALDAYAAALRLHPALFGRIAQALVSPRVGRLWLQPGALRAELAARG